MKNGSAFVTLILLLVSANAAAQDKECGDGSSVSSTACLNVKAFEVVDRELDAAYKKLINAMGTDDTWRYARERLTASQTDWKNYRDRQCQLEGALSGGASQAPYFECVVRMTKDRTSYFATVLGQFH